MTRGVKVLNVAGVPVAVAALRSSTGAGSCQAKDKFTLSSLLDICQGDVGSLLCVVWLTEWDPDIALAATAGSECLAAYASLRGLNAEVSVR